ncbi:hypothetical protein BO71DRAFT_480693 [Aspergillus ellipticus CBS 707.79]|uniref:Uncharacterized protein n=1 Tax=Aspergillus ellipticus CBS 707.79 TaxID=1448320 RepID=A0A319F0X2_9EURO|nr:hypothetical protein BO71DRAFT_480693 [Aspergillus ellipticus CBS 707.79]
MRYGSNYGRTWIGNTSNPSPAIFGISNLRSLLGMMKNIGARVQVLRSLCTQYQLESPPARTRYMLEQKRKWDEYKSEEKFGGGLEIPPGESWNFIAPMTASNGRGPLSTTPGAFDMLHAKPMEDAYGEYHSIFEELMEDTPGNRQSVLFDFVFGDHQLAAVYRRRTAQPSLETRTFSSTVWLEIVQDLLDGNQLRLDTVADRRLDPFSAIQPAHGDSLLALGRYQKSAKLAEMGTGNASQIWIYQPRLLRISNPAPLVWTQRISRLYSPYPVATPFSLLINFCTIQTFAGGMSSGAVSHVLGNMGKPGTALLVTPPELEIRGHHIERWHFVSHHPFDGKASGGMFDGMSLHLCLTGWEGPLSVNVIELSNSGCLLLGNNNFRERRGRVGGRCEYPEAAERTETPRRASETYSVLA